MPTSLPSRQTGSTRRGSCHGNVVWAEAATRRGAPAACAARGSGRRWQRRCCDARRLQAARAQSITSAVAALDSISTPSTTQQDSSESAKRCTEYGLELAQVARVAEIPVPLPPGGVPLEGELRKRWCVKAADHLDAQTVVAKAKAKAKATGKARPVKKSGLACKDPLPPGVWAPAWTVLSGHDAFPGQDVGRPVDKKFAGKAKDFCVRNGLAGMVMAFGMLFLRPQTSAEELRGAAQKEDGASLILRSSSNAATPPRAVQASGAEGTKREPSSSGSAVRVAVLATQDEFDETSVFELGMVSNTGNGRRYAAQAMLRSIQEAEGLELVALLIYDWKNSEDKDSDWPVPAEGPERFTVSIRGGSPVTGWRGNYTQLLGAASGELCVDVALSIQARSTSLDLLLKAITARKHLVMGHDYNLPYGVWGMEVDPKTLPEHTGLMEDKRVTMLCTSKHLAEYVDRWSEGRVATRLCYCADYGYFDPPGGSGSFPPLLCESGNCVTLISPCPAKGLPILVRLAVALPHVHFLCVSTGWTKSIHEVQLQLHENVEVIPGTDDIDSVYRRSAILLVPSLWQESFGLVAVEAQLRGVPVVSTDSCGLSEANFLPELRVAGVRLIHDSRARNIIRGMTMEEAERSLDPMRPGQNGIGAEKYNEFITHAHTYVASEEEAAGFIKLVSSLMSDRSHRRELGMLAREKAVAHVEERRGQLARLIREAALEPAPA